MDEFEDFIWKRLFNINHRPLDQQAKDMVDAIRKEFFVVSKKNIDIYFKRHEKDN